MSLDPLEALRVPAPSTTPLAASTPLSGSVTPERLRRVIVLCGVVGTGKSSLSKSIVAQLPGYVRVCQDELGDRRACEEMTRSYLEQGLSVIVDRQNFDSKQRQHWCEVRTVDPLKRPYIKVAAQIARRFNVEVCAVVFTTPYQECQRRLQARTNHETVDNPVLALQLLDQFTAAWRPPTANEDFDRITRLPSVLPLNPSIEDLESLIALIDSSPKLPRQQTLPFGRDGSGRGGRSFAPPPRGGAWGGRGNRLGSA